MSTLEKMGIIAIVWFVFIMIALLTILLGNTFYRLWVGGWGITL